MPQIIAGVLIIQDESYVVQKRDNIPNIAEPGMLSLWGGAADNDETPKQAAVRELLEETGISIDEKDLTLLSNYQTHGRSPAFIGKTIDVFSYVLNVNSRVEVHCYEGEKTVRFTKLSEALGNGEKLTDMLSDAIEKYEALR